MPENVETDNEVLKGLEKFDKELDACIAIKQKIETEFCKSTDHDIKKDRKFQLDMLKVQLGNDIGGSIISVIVSIQVAILAVILTLNASLTGFVSSEVLLGLILFLIGTIIATVLVSWYFFGIFRNKRIKEIEDEFINDKKSEANKSVKQ